MKDKQIKETTSVITVNCSLVEAVKKIMRILTTSRGIFIVLVTTILFHTSSAIVCPSGYCEEEGRCNEEPTEADCIDSGREYRPNSSFCECCATCVDYLRVGDECDVEKLHLRGIPQVLKNCPPDSECINNVCQKQTDDTAEIQY